MAALTTDHSKAAAGQHCVVANLPPEKVMHPTFASWRTTVEKISDSREEKETDSAMKQSIEKSFIPTDPSEVSGVSRR
jgi:hypothetical protein